MHRDEDGLSLPELLVTMVIMSIVLAALSGMFIQSMRQHRLATAKATSQADTRTAMEVITRDLRVAIPGPGRTSVLMSAAPNSVSFYTQRRPGGLNGTVTKVTYTLETTNCLRRTSVEANRTTWVENATTQQSVCVSQGMFLMPASGAAPTFTYLSHDKTGNSSQVPVPSGGQTTDSALQSITVVSVSLTAQAKGYEKAAQPTSVVQQVTLSNRVHAQNRDEG